MAIDQKFEYKFGSKMKNFLWGTRDPYFNAHLITVLRVTDHMIPQLLKINYCEEQFD